MKEKKKKNSLKINKSEKIILAVSLLGLALFVDILFDTTEYKIKRLNELE